MEPSVRLKRLSNIAEEFSVDRNQPIIRYYRSGVEMLGMAHTYFNEGNLENAYILYLKYMTLFIEKIRAHPEFKTADSAMKSKNKSKIKEVMSRSENIKKELKDKYEAEYLIWQKEQEEKRRREEAKRIQRLADEEEERENQIQENINKYHQEKEKSIREQRDLEASLYQQLQINQYDGVQPSAPPPPPPPSEPETEVPPKATPSIDRSNKPSSNHNNLGLYDTSDASALRRLEVPSKIISQFLSLAKTNTNKNIETCGILAGKLSQNKFRITHLLIPKQSGTSDSCTMDDEIAIFTHQEQFNLITLGWIHTHPSQTAFLSSVDLHNHLSYQLMMPEAIAIVCSPKYEETGYFSITPYGMNFLGKCRETGFHPHPKEPPLFEDGSHIDHDYQSDVSVVDLR